MAIWQTLKSAIVGVGVGEATADALTPILTPAAQDAWQKNPYKALAATVAAELVAQGLTSQGDANDEAALTGINPQRLGALIQAALTAPGVPEALTLWRRGAITEDGFVHALRKSALEPMWDEPLESLKDDRLSPQVIALAIVRGLVADPGILPVGPPSAVGNVPAFPSFGIDALAEAAAAGFDLDRLGVMVGINGRPASPQEAAQGVYRGILQQADYERAISEGDVRNEWAASLFEIFRQIPTAHDGIEMRLRNYFTTDEEMYAFTARHGMSQADTDVLFNVTGRPLSWHQTWTGTQRGGALAGPTDMIDPAFLDSLRKSNIRPEYYNLAWYDRNPVPAAFMVRQWLKDGGSTDQARKWLTDQGWLDADITAIIKEYAATPTTSTNKHVTSAVTSLVTATRKAYIGLAATQADAATALTAAGVDVPTQTQLFSLWDANRVVDNLTGDTAVNEPH